jgi:hypothetical protein
MSAAGQARCRRQWLFRSTPDRKGIHPHAHLFNFTGALHTNGYAGFDCVAGGAHT